MVGWILVIAAAIATAYLLGRRSGIVDANRSAVTPGSWVEVVRPLRCRPNISGPAGTLPVGTQAVVTGINKWGRLTLWIAQPWASHWGSIPQVFDVADFARLRAKPLHTVPTETRDATLSALAAWEAKVERTEARLFPPGFLDVQRLLSGR